MGREAFLRGVERELERLDLTEDDGLNEQSGRRAVLLASSERLWARHLGQLFDTEQVQAMLNVTTRAAVAERVKRLRLLALPGAGRARSRFPAWQFSERGQPYPQLVPVLVAFRDAGVDNPWTVASWFQSPQATLDGRRPVEWLKDDGPADRLLIAARMSAQTLAA